MESNGKTIEFEARFPLNTKTRNNRIYTAECMKQSISAEYIQEQLKTGGLLGMIRNTTGMTPCFDSTKLGVDPAKAAFSLREIDVVEGDSETAVIGKGKTLDTPYGRELVEAIGRKIAFSIAPRGIGSIVDGVVQPDFRLITFDLIPEPNYPAGEHYEDFHSRYMPIGEFLIRSYDGDPDVDPSEILDQYWLDMISKINKSESSDEEILVYLKKTNTDPNFIESIRTHEGNISIKLRMASMYGSTGDTHIPNSFGKLYPEDPNAKKYIMGIDKASGKDKTVIRHPDGRQEVIE